MPAKPVGLDIAMAENSAQDRNLPASQRRLEKAREEGQVPRSRDLGHFGAVAAAAALLWVGAPRLTAALQTQLTQGLRFDHKMLVEPSLMGERLVELGALGLAVLIPLGAVMVLVAMLCGVASGGWNWSPKAITPKFDKLNPFAGLGRLVSKQQFIEALKGSALALLLLGLGAWYLQAHVAELAGVWAMPLPTALAQSAHTMGVGLGFMVLALAAFAMVDVPLQQHLHAQRLKMSHQELKQEHKELEGNQEIKAKLRARMREMTKRRMLAAVPKADLVVMNPTHYAVALKYDDTSMGAPRVVAKGADLLAMRIRDVAQGAKVPVLQAPVLARALYAHAELDREIPAALFSAVAQVLAYVYQLRAAMAGAAPMPAEMPELVVPVELDPHHAKADLVSGIEPEDHAE